MAMARCTTLSDSDSVDEEQILKLFDSEDEIDKSFSGFSSPAKQTTELSNLTQTNMAAPTQKVVVEPTKPKKSNANKGKAPANKHKRADDDLEMPSGSSVQVSPIKKKPRVSKSKPKSSKSASKTPNAVDNTELIKSLFKGLSDKLTSTLNKKAEENVNNNPKPNINDRVRALLPVMDDNNENTISDDNDTINHNNEIGEDFNIFSDEENDIVEVSDDDFDYELPNIFEDEKFDTEVSPSLAKVFDSICKRKADVSSMVKEMKIPSNCKSLVPPPVNSEIWMFLERRAKTSDLNFQTLQKLLASGMVPLIKMAEILKTKTPNIKQMREYVSKSMAILSNTHFELSIRRRMSLKPHIDRKYHQLCNRNENVGNNLFGDDVGKRLKDINEINKINKNLTSNSRNMSTGFRGYRGRQSYQNRFLGRRGSYAYPRQNQRYMSQRGKSVMKRRPNV